MSAPVHLADADSFQLALMSGLVHPPRPEWDSGERRWHITARPSQGGASWVLAREQGVAGFSDWEQARQAAEGLLKGGGLYLVARR